MHYISSFVHGWRSGKVLLALHQNLCQMYLSSCFPSRWLKMALDSVLLTLPAKSCGVELVNRVEIEKLYFGFTSCNGTHVRWL